MIDYIRSIQVSLLKDKDGKAELVALSLMAKPDLTVEHSRATIRDISLRVGRSSATVQRRLQSLKDAGLLTTIQLGRKAHYQLPTAQMVEEYTTHTT